MHSLFLIRWVFYLSQSRKVIIPLKLIIAIIMHSFLSLPHMYISINKVSSCGSFKIAWYSCMFFISGNTSWANIAPQGVEIGLGMGYGDSYSPDV